jgi:hypothetical protein
MTLTEGDDELNVIEDTQLLDLLERNQAIGCTSLTRRNDVYSIFCPRQHSLCVPRVFGFERYKK